MSSVLSADSLAEQLLTEQNECSFCWLTQDGSPTATVVSFVYFDKTIWMTALKDSALVKAIVRNPKTAISISGKGCSIGHSRCLSLRGICGLETSDEIRSRFFPAFANAVLRNSTKGAALMAGSMNSPENAVLSFTPYKSIPYDAKAMYDQADSL